VFLLTPTMPPIGGRVLRGSEGTLRLAAIGRQAYENGMRLFAAVVVLSALISQPQPLRAEDQPTPGAVRGDAQSAYTTTGALPGARVESVLTDPKGAATTTTPGTGWLLHAGPREKDTCDEIDATSGLRMMCVAW